MSDELPLQPLLTVLSGPWQGAQFRLTAGRRTIGREPGVDILLDDIRVSRQHAVLEVVGGRTTLTDNGSTNGTWLNGRRLCGTHELRDGDQIRLGTVDLRFYDPSGATTDPVGMRFDVLALDPPRPAVPRPVSGALTAPTEPIAPRQSVRRLFMVVGSGLMLAAWMAWAYLILH